MRYSLILLTTSLISVFLWIIFTANIINCRPVTVLAPSQPSIEKQKGQAQNEKGKNSQQGADAPENPPEVDVLISLMEPFENQGVDMDMPQLFAALIWPPQAPGAEIKAERRDLLGDVEEIRYLDRKAWGANVSLDQPGLYQFTLEAKPRWNENENMFRQQTAKVMLPVLGVENGWDRPAGQSFEIIPLNRPFGLTAPALFSGRVIFNDKPVENIKIQAGRINTNKAGAPTEWHKTLVAKTDERGQFSIILNQPGWWYCEAERSTDPLKGADGQMKAAMSSAIIWLYVDAPVETKGRK